MKNPNTQQLATRMTTLGTIEFFNPSLEDWNAYYERFDQYVITNEIKEEKKIMATFLTSIGSKTYNVLRDLITLVKPSSLKLTDGYAYGSRSNQGERRQPVRYVEDDILEKEPDDDFKLFHIHQE